jgi:hypothetical protein
MAKIPLPERGQPLDLSYIYQIANALNNLSSEVSPSAYKYVTIDNSNIGKQNLRVSETRIIAGFIEVSNSEEVTAGNSKSFSYPFSTDFKYAPVVTATILNTGSDTGNDVSLVLNSVTKSGINGTVKFAVGGKVTVGVNILAFGVPS